MTVTEQAWANFIDSKVTSTLGFLVILLRAACAAGLVDQLLSPQMAALLCNYVTPSVAVTAGAALMVSRGPATPPR